MFDTERFITEMENKPCIWNLNSQEYSNRELKYSAWNEIAEIMYKDWEYLEEDLKSKKVQDLQKKWKGLRDYYIREKNKETAFKKGSGPPKKRKSTLLNMLNFLRVIKKKNPASHHGNHTECNTCTVEKARVESSKAVEETISPVKPKKVSVCQDELPKPIEKRREDDPDMSFLLNILPEMKSMTPNQNFDFRFEVMKIIKHIKYNDSNYSSGSYFTDQPGCS